jgi:hypothetical protein
MVARGRGRGHFSLCDCGADDTRTACDIPAPLLAAGRRHTHEVGLAFEGRSGQRIEPRAWWHGHGVLRIEEVHLEWIESRAPRAPFGVPRMKAPTGDGRIASRSR